MEKQDTEQKDPEPHYPPHPIYVPSYDSEVAPALTDTLVSVPEARTREQGHRPRRRGHRTKQKVGAEDKDEETDKEIDYMDNINDTLATLRVAYV